MSRVYFIKPVGMKGPVKIGCSISPEVRRSTLDTWSPFALEIIAEIASGVALERRFHAAFRATHERREWFGWSPEIEGAIERINTGSFDTESLPAPMWVCRQTGKADMVLGSPESAAA